MKLLIVKKSDTLGCGEHVQDMASNTFTQTLRIFISRKSGFGNFFHNFNLNISYNLHALQN